MDYDELFNKLKADLKIAAQEYQKLLSVTIVFESKNFKLSKIYNARFYKQNFLHLTGVKTNLSTGEYFKRCLDESISKENILNFPDAYRSTIYKKVKNLKTIFSFFTCELLVQENFTRNTVTCVIATSDGYKTLGFVNTKPYIRPMTLMSRNLLDKNKKVLQVTPIIKSN